MKISHEYFLIGKDKEKAFFDLKFKVRAYKPIGWATTKQDLVCFYLDKSGRKIYVEYMDAKFGGVFKISTIQYTQYEFDVIMKKVGYRKNIPFYISENIYDAISRR